MTIPLDPWSAGLQVASMAISHSAELQNLWDRVWATVSRRNSKIVVTGIPGVGKTVLFDHISGLAGNPAYELPSMSRAPEIKRLKQGDQRWAVTVVPGQSTPVKTQTLDTAFRSGRPIDGVIYVVANGFATLREKTVERAIIERGQTLSLYREEILKAEVSDFRAMGNELRAAFHRTNNRPRNPWLLIAANKADLYCGEDEMQAAYGHYGAAGGRFFDEITSLVGLIGSDNLRFEVLPVASYAESFALGNEEVASSMTTQQRSRTLVDFMRAMAGLCDGR